MKQFSEFAIETKVSFEGPSITIEEVLEKEIIVDHIKIGPSIKKPGTECLTMQITFEGTKHVIFSGSLFLMHPLRSMGHGDFPFMAKIIRVNKHFEFR
jgi:hypothetical protein